MISIRTWSRRSLCFWETRDEHKPRRATSCDRRSIHQKQSPIRANLILPSDACCLSSLAGAPRIIQSPFADGDPYRGQLAISDVHSFLYAEPGTQTQIPQVRGFLRNLGHQTLIMVEITLSFKDRRNRVIFEETAYPVYVSSLSNPHGSKSLAPGQQIKFAFKSPACPKDWQPGQVDVRVTKVVAGNS